MNSSVQYSALTRLLAQNNRVHDLEEMLRQMPVRLLEVEDDWARFEENDLNPFAETQDEMDREARASLVTCWLGLTDPEEESL